MKKLANFWCSLKNEYQALILNFIFFLIGLISIIIYTAITFNTKIIATYTIGYLVTFFSFILIIALSNSLNKNKLVEKKGQVYHQVQGISFLNFLTRMSFYLGFAIIAAVFKNVFNFYILFLIYSLPTLSMLIINLVDNNSYKKNKKENSKC